MSYRNINRDRFRFLLNLGMDDFELSGFFTDCRLQLIHHGAKVQNLPHGRKARIRVLAGELPRATDEVTRSWFAKHVTMVDPEEAEAVVGVFKRYEDVGDELPEESARRYARSCLVHLFSEKPSRSLVEFLKTPIGETSAADDEAIEFPENQRESLKTYDYLVNLPQVLVKLVDGQDVDEHLEGLPPELATFISGIQFAARDQINEARDIVHAFQPESPLRSHLEQYLRSQEARRVSRVLSPRGLKITDPEEFDGGYDYERDEVLGYCTKADQPSAVFVRSLMVFQGGQLRLLTNEKRQELFPDTGDLIAFTGRQYPRQPSRGEVGVWGVAEHYTEKATHFHLALRKRAVYEVRSVPFSSTEYDAVREFLKEQGERSGGVSLQPLLFQLNDGLIIGGRAERPDFSKEETFDSGLLSWNSLPAIRLEGRLFVIGALPKEHGIYECAGLGSTVRKLFRPHVGVGKVFAGLTRVQLTQLANSIGDIESSIDNLRIQRVRSELERLGQQQEAFETLVKELINHPDVKLRIDQLVKHETARQLDQKTSLQADIARLQKERGEWEDRIRREKAEHKKLRDETSKVVKAAFDKARAEGVSTLAEVEIFQALSRPVSEVKPRTEAVARHSVLLAPLVIRDLAPGDKDVISMLRSLGISGQCATAFATVGEIAHKAGLIVCVRGIAARLIVEGWARAIANSGVLVDSTVGLVDDSALKGVLAKVPRPDVVALLDANLSALDIYARPLSDLVLVQLSTSGHGQPLSIFLTLSDSVGALPLPKTFERLAVLIDLDTRYRFLAVADLDALMATATNPEDGTLYMQLWRPAAERLCREIESLKLEERALALSVLAAR
jgi:hypothetical protein